MGSERITYSNSKGCKIVETGKDDMTTYLPNGIVKTQTAWCGGTSSHIFDPKLAHSDERDSETVIRTN